MIDNDKVETYARYGRTMPTWAELIAGHSTSSPIKGSVINEFKLVQSYLCWSHDHSMRIEHAIRYLEFTNGLIKKVEKAHKERGLLGVIDVTEMAVICNKVRF